MIEIMQQVIQSVVSEVLAPAVARTGDLDGVIQHVKYSVARHVREAGLQPEILAKHFGKSERSIYRYFEQTEHPGKKGDSGHEGVQLMARILEYYYTRKVAMPKEACIRFLRRQDPSISPAEIEGLLDLYAALGHLRKITEEEGGNRAVRFQAPEQAHVVHAVPDGAQRIKSLSKKLKALLPIMLSYARQEDGAGITVLRGRVGRKQLSHALEDIQDYALKRWQDAVDATARDELEEREEVIEACTLVMGGPGSLEEMHIERTGNATHGAERATVARAAAGS